MTLVGFVAPPSRLTGDYAKARKQFGGRLLSQIESYGADTIRFQVSEGGLDPQSSIYDAQYRSDVLAAVSLARRRGFVVIVCMQWEPASGSSSESNMPSDVTRRAWAQIAPAFNGDGGIMLEVFNEPGLKTDTPANWSIWRSDMQQLVNSIRRSADNILLLDGLRGAKYLTRVPQINDSLNRIGYAVHPFLEPFNRTQAQWESNWGAFARGKPVIATAFNAISNRTNQCFPAVPQTAANLLTYLGRLKIGLSIWAYDMPSVQKNGVLTNYDNFSCNSRKMLGAGQLVSDYYQRTN